MHKANISDDFQEVIFKLCLISNKSFLKPVHLSDYLILKKKKENIVLSYVFMDNAREKFCVHHPLCNLLINKSITICKTHFCI